MSAGSSTHERLANLDPQRRALLERRLRGTAPAPREATGPVLVEDREHRGDPFPLNDVQLAYWLGRGSGLDVGDASIQMYWELEVVDLDVDRLAHAWTALVARHEMLRVVVSPDGTQRILPSVGPVAVEVTDLRDHTGAARSEELDRRRRSFSHEEFDLETWPWFAVRVSLLPERLARVHITLDGLHIDGGSYLVLTHELVALYRAETLPPAPTVSFRDYVLATAASRDDEPARAAAEYWRARLTDLPPAPALPLACRPSALTRVEFRRRSGRLDPTGWARLRAAAGTHRVTASAVLMAAYGEVLATWSEAPHFTVNLSVFNRAPLHPDIDRIVGNFTTLMPLEIRVDPTDTWATSVRRVHEQTWLDMDHRDIGGGTGVLRELARIQGITSGAALPVVFTSTVGIDQRDDQGLEALGEVVHAVSQTPQVWLDCQVREAAGGLEFTWDWVDGLFPPGLLEAMFDAFDGWLRRVAGDGTVWDATVPDLVPDEQRRRHDEANATATSGSEDTLVSLVRRSVAARPDATAVVHDGRELTYAALDDAAEHAARRMVAAGVEPGDTVAVLVPKGAEQVVAVLGVHRAGGIYVPLDPALPPSRRAWLLEHSGARAVVVSEAEVADRLRRPDGPALVVLGPEAGDERLDVTLPVPPRPDDVSHLIYTSGSTGHPKGVTVTHANVVNRLDDVLARFAITADDRVLALTALHHDLSVFDVFGTLAAGGLLVVPRADLVRDPAHWTELIDRHAVSIWNSVPAFAELLVDHVEHATVGGGRAPAASLRRMLLAGDWIPVSLPGRARALWPHLAFTALGGPTETTVWDICHEVGEVDPERVSIPYGRPMANSRYHVLAPTGRERPDWVPGELHIGGAGLARGYWRDEEATAAAFALRPGQGRLYASGDLGRWRPDGTIEFLGRRDHQVKVRGHRIELGEIEAALLAHPGVAAAVVTPVGDDARERTLTAHVVATETPAGVATGGGDVDGTEFVLAGHGLRTDGEPVALPAPDTDPVERIARLAARRSYRRFEQDPVPLAAVAELLANAARVPIEGVPLPKALYPSAGSLYPVQTYLHVKHGRVDGLAGGAYYHHPVHHLLHRLTTADDLPRDVHAPVNHTLADEAAFTVVLVADRAAMDPVYGAITDDYTLLEAGYLAQTLMLAAPTLGLGLCPVGALAPDRLARDLALRPTHRVLHALAGGGLLAGQQTPDGWRRDLGVTGTAAVTDGLRRHLAATLPAPLVPARIMAHAALPLTANGKVDRAALSREAADRSRAPAADDPPATPGEVAIGAIVARITGAEVGRTENLLDAGVTSAHLVAVRNALAAELGSELSVVELFEHSSVAALATALTSGSGRGDELGDRRARGARRREARRPR